MELFSSVEVTPMLASIESIFIFLVIAAISAMFGGKKKRKEGDIGEDWATRQAPPRIPRQTSQKYTPSSVPPAKKQVDWEEELRRMLQGTNPQPPPIPKPAPPVPRTPPPRPQPVSRPEPSPALPKIFRQERLYKGHCENCGGHLEFRPEHMEETVPCPHCNQLTVLRPFTQTKVETLTHKATVGDFGKGAQTWQRASTLDQRVGTDMAARLRRPVDLTKAQVRTQRSPEIDSAVALLATPRTARQAVIASLIFSPPKAME